MFRVLTCLADEHDWRLVILAALVCFAASLVAINIFHRADASQGRSRLIWVAIAGGAIGYGIWATHFVAMLAYDPGIVAGYGVTLTTLSLATAMLLTSCGFGLAASRGGSWGGAPLGGAVIGAGIASMHYLGMSALELPGRVTWSAELVVASIVLGILLGMTAMTIAVSSKDRLGTTIAALFLTLAIVSHHFTAMGAVEIMPDPTRLPQHLFLSPGVLALAIAGVALSILGMSFIGVLADRRMAVRTQSFEQIIRELSDARCKLEASRSEAHEQKFRLDTAIDNMSQGLLLFDASERIVVCNKRYIDLYGLSPDIVRPGCLFRDLINHRKTTGSFSGDVEAYRLDLLGSLASGKPSEKQIDLPDGRAIQIVNQPLADGGWVATHEDVTEKRRFDARIAYMAHHDALTGLANRAAITQSIEDAAARQRKSGEPFAVLLLDLDRFKQVNDTLGHPAGDSLLREAASRLKSAMRATDILGRLGGDEFAVIQLDAVNQRQAASAFASRIIEILSEPFSIDHHDINVGTSIGIALAPEDATNPEDLLKMADLALYHAKSVGGSSFQFFTEAMTTAAIERRELESELRRAIRSGEFELHYQPIVDARTLKICSAEALLRWRHPTKGIIYPDEFIPLAEENGLISQIGKWVLRAACREAASWPQHIKLAINLSPAQFRSVDLRETVLSALSDSGLSPRRLELEITETALIHSALECLPVLHHLKGLGVAIALDDFGTGYSSLSQLTVFPFDKIKIDKSFTRDMTARADCAAIIEATLTLAKRLGMATTAEGIETSRQLESLRSAGVTCLQGYLFQRPRPPAEIDFGATFRNLLAMEDAA